MIDPASAYLASLGTEDSRRTMASALSRVALAMGVDASRDPTAKRSEAWRLYDWSTVEAGRVEAAIREIARDRRGATVAKLLAAVKGVAAAGFRSGAITADTLERIRLIRGVREVPDLRGREVVRSEREALEQACDGSARGDRDRALIALLFGGGLRRSEAAKVELAGWSPRSPALRFTGKGRKTRTVAFASADAEKINRWIATRGLAPGPLLYAFSPSGEMQARGITGSRIYKIVRALAATAGIEKCTPHDGRRTHATELFRANVRPRTAQDQLGHSNLSTTVRYDRSADEERMREVEAALSGK